jgi:hypothetical protein
MPSRVAASLVASLESFSTYASNRKPTFKSVGAARRSGLYDVTIYHTVRMYEDYGVRLGLQKSVSGISFTVIELLRRLILERTLVAPTFDATVKESAMELAYRLIMEMRRLRMLHTDVSISHLRPSNREFHATKIMFR